MSPHRLIPLLGLMLLVWMRPLAQNCGSLDTVILDAGMTTTYPLTIEDVLVDDLADPGQGVCGVELHFAHQYVYDLEISLTSPGGQTVELIGPNNAQSRPPTLFTRWFIDFTSCGESPAPDAGAPDAWDNNHPFNWVSGGLYRGTYHPFSGCLEDFDAGAVNGTWTLNVRSNRNGARGGIVYFRMLFCDDRGIDCCFADAGTLLVSATERCEEHPDLDLSPNPVYGRPRPAEETYGYTYLIGREGLYHGLDSLADLTDEAPGRYTVCGLSYRRGELDNLPAPDGVLTVEEIRTNLESFTPYLCGDLTQACYSIEILPTPDTTRLDEIICAGDAFAVGDSLYENTGRFFTTLTGRGLCDSVVLLDLEVVDELRTTLVDTVCYGETVRVGDETFATSGTFTVGLTADGGCDSIVTLNLIVRDSIGFDTTLAICAGDSFLAGNEELTATGVYDRVLTSIDSGCDSFLTVDLAVLNPQLFLADVPIINCFFSTATIDVRPSMTEHAAAFRWLDLDGNQLGTADTLLTDRPGFYVIELTETFRGVSCTVRDTVEVVDLTDRPTVDAGTTDTLNCSVNSLTLGGAGTDVGSNYRYAWTGPGDAVFWGPTDEATVEVASPGTYQLRVFNATTGCRDSAEVLVRIDTLPPVATIGGLETLNCANVEVRLFADTTQSRRSELEFRWTGDCLPIPVTGPVLTLDCPGTVTLTVRNLTNGCETSETVVVTQEIDVPRAVVSDPGIINCYFPERILDAAASTPDGDIIFEWSNQLGGVIGTDPALTVNAAQTYRLVLTDTTNTCRDTTFYVVTADLTPPAADAGADSVDLTCFDPMVELGGAATSAGSPFSYAWYRRGEAQDTLGRERRLTVGAPREVYVFSVFNQDNGCRATDTVRVRDRLDPPFLRIDLPEEFSCFTDSVMLDAGRTFLGFDRRITWTGPCLPEEVDTAVVAVNCPGQYTFSVVNLETGCAADSTVEVVLAENSVVAILPDTARIDCSTGSTRIDRSQSTRSTRTTWLLDGAEIGLIGTNPLVTVPGTYTMIISNFDASCSDTASVEVVADCPLLAVIVPPDSITCDRSQVTLNGGPSIPDDSGEIATEWIVPNPACVTPGATDRQLVTACPGVYGFVITNLTLGTSDTAFVEVVRNLRPPEVEAGPNDTLNCYDPRVVLDAAASEQNDNYLFVWLNSGTDTVGIGQTATVNAPGIYFLQVRNQSTGCNSTDAVTVFRDVRTPDLDFSDEFIPCRQDSFALTVFPEPEAGNYGYEWAGPLIRFNGDSATVILGRAGTYTATVTNLDNGCPAAASVNVEQLPCPPCLLLADTVLTCTVNPLPLRVEFCEPCVDCTFEWFQDGLPINGADSSVLEVNVGGNYRVRVTNAAGLSTTTSSEVTDQRVVPDLAAGPDRTLTCDSSSVLLGRTIVDTVYGYTYQWFAPAGAPVAGGDGNFLRVSEAGTYKLLVRNPVSTCEVMDSITVRYDTLPPNVTAGPDMELTCEDRFAVLSGSGTSAGSNFRFQWTGGPGEACLEGANTLSPIAICGGDYVLTVRNQSTGCVNRDTVRVTASDELPAILPLPDTVLSCGATRLVLSAAVDDPGYQRQWCLDDAFGEVDPATCRDGSTVTIDSAATYHYVVTNPVTGCFNDFRVTVGTDYRAPTADAGRSDTLFCTLDSLGLFGSAITRTGGVAEYRWRSLRGFPLGGPDQDTAYAYLPDVYELTVTDRRNGCSAMDTVELFRDIAAPSAEAGLDTTLNCQRRQLRLSGTGQTLSGQSRYNWTTNDGTLLSGTTTTTPLVGGVGDYIFAVTDPVNNCTAADVVRVTEDTLRPTARLVPVDTFLVNCFFPTLELNAGPSTTASGRPLTYTWSTLGAGTALNGQTDSIVTIDAGGSYRITVSDPVNACRDTMRIAVSANFSPPGVRVTPPNLLTCDTVFTTLVASPLVAGSPYTFGWSPMGATTVTEGAELRVSFPGQFMMTARDTTNGCLTEREVTVLANRTLPELELNAPDPLGCDRATTFVTATALSEGPDFSLSWRSPDGLFLPTASPDRIRAREPGIYILTVEDRRNGCAVSDTARVRRLAQAITALTLDVEDPACVDDLDGSVAILGVEGGTPPYRFRLDGGLLTDRMFYDGLPLGEHAVTIVDGSGCERTESFVLEAGPEVLLSLGPDLIVRLGDSVALTFTTNLPAWDTLIWRSLGPIPEPGAHPLVIRPDREYFYELLIRDANGCEGYDNVRVSVDNEIYFYVPNIFSPNGDSRNDLFFPFAGSQVNRVLTFRVFDRWGNLMHEALDFVPNDPSFGWDGTLNGRAVNNNVFIWQAQLELFDGKREFRYGDVVLRR